MDILIKSFNRPYYLDKCLSSIVQFVSGFEQIKILDDGTNDLHLQKIQSKYPFIGVYKSELAKEKQYQVQNQTAINNQIPVNLWLTEAHNSSEYFVLIEDDMWFTKPIDLAKLSEDLKNIPVEMVKLFWLNNSILVSNNTENINDQIEVYQSEIEIKSPFWYQFVFHSKIPKARFVFEKLGLFSNKKELKYYQMYNVAGAIFSKKYFLSLWNYRQKNVNESSQIINALNFFKKNPHSKIAKFHSEVLKTGFATSALQKEFVTNFSIEKANLVLNELWFLDKIAIDNSLDINILSVKQEIIQLTNDEFYENWLLWVQKFKQQYLDFGCKINE